MIHMESEFFRSLVIILGVSALVVFLLHKLKIPSIVGFLVAGVIVGPYGVGLVRDTRVVEAMADEQRYRNSDEEERRADLLR